MSVPGSDCNRCPGFSNYRKRPYTVTNIASRLFQALLPSLTCDQYLVERLTYCPPLTGVPLSAALTRTRFFLCSLIPTTPLV